MIDSSTVTYLRYAHGLYNVLVFVLVLYQGLLGIKIRRERIRGDTPSFRLIARHRHLGPVLTVAGIAGFVSGLIVVLLNTGTYFIFRTHFIAGLIATIFIATAHLSSHKIKGRDSRWRTPHLAAGTIFAFIYAFQIFLGLRLLL